MTALLEQSLEAKQLCHDFPEYFCAFLNVRMVFQQFGKEVVL